MKTHKYEELASALWELAESLEPGARFLTHREVMHRYQVSDRTALRSLEELQRHGRIVRRSGVGTFVADRATAATAAGVAAPRRHLGARGSNGYGHAAAAARATLLVFALSDSPFFQNAVDVIAAQAAAADMTMVCHYVRRASDGAPADVDLSSLDILRPAGVLIFGYLLEPVAVRAQAQGVRTVLVGVPPVSETPGVTCLFADHEESGYQAARRLLDLGHRRIAMAYEHCQGSGLQDTYRWRGFARALDEAGVSPDAAASLTPPAETAAWRSDPDRAAAFFSRPDAPTAIAAWNDWEARTLLRTLRRAGVRVPADVSLIGHDNDPAGADLEPALDTVDQHIDVQVRCALRLLTSEQPLPQTSTVVVPTLLPRASCAAAPPPRHGAAAAPT